MTNTAGQGSDYTDPHTHSFATESAAAPPVKKKNKFMQVLILVVGVLFVGFAAFVGWGMISKKPAPAPQQQVAAPVEAPAPEAEPPVDPNAAAIDPAATPLDPSLAPTDPTALDPAMLAGSPVDPSTGMPIEPIAPIDPAAAVPVVGAPTDPAAAPVVDPIVAAPVVTPSAPAVVAAPTPPAVAVVNDPASSGLSDVMNSARQEMMGALDRIEKRLQEMDLRFSALDARVTGLETGRTAVAPRPAVAATPKPAVRKKRPASTPAKPTPARPVQQNRLEILDSGSSLAPVSRATIIDGRVQPDSGNRIQVVDAQPASAPRAAAASCSIRSIQPGRVWIRRANGSFATYGVGDTLPDGRRVDSIDPNAGVMAGGRSWNC
jgi:hypothetical protein